MSTENTKHLDGHIYSVLDKLQKQIESKEYCDVVIQVGDSEFPAHRCVLAACSDYFDKMFTTDMIEKSSKVVTIKEIKPDTMKNILTCIYTGEIELSMDNIEEVLHVASLIQLNQILENIFVQINLCLLNAETACFFHHLAISYSLEKLEEFVYETFLSKFLELSVQLDFLDLDKEVIGKMISSDDLIIEEETQVFEFLIKWVQVDEETRKQQFPELFKHVRLQLISMKYIIEFIQCNYLVKRSHVCRDVIDEMMSFHIFPSAVKAQKSRKSPAPKPDSAILLPFEKIFHSIFKYKTNQLFDTIFDGTTCGTVMEETAVATKFPVSVFCGGKASYYIEKVPYYRATSKVVQFNGVKWIDLPPMIQGRCGAAAVFLNDELFVFGGETEPIPPVQTYCGNNPGYTKFSRTFEKYNTEWNSYDSLFSPRSHFAAHSVGGKIYLIGGYKPTHSESSEDLQFVKFPCNETLIFTPQSNSLRKIGNLNQVRASFASAASRFAIYVVGGVFYELYSYSTNSVNSIEYLEVYQEKWITVTECSNLESCTAILLSECSDVQLWIYSQNENKIFLYDAQTKEIHFKNETKFPGIILPFNSNDYLHPFP